MRLICVAYSNKDSQAKTACGFVAEDNFKPVAVLNLQFSPLRSTFK